MVPTHPFRARCSVARVGLLGAAALRTAVLRRELHHSPPRALAAAARRRALAPRRPRAQRARDNAVCCLRQGWAACASLRRGPCDDVARAVLPAGGGVALGPAIPLADGAVDLQTLAIRSMLYRSCTKCAPSQRMEECCTRRPPRCWRTSRRRASPGLPPLAAACAYRRRTTPSTRPTGPTRPARTEPRSPLRRAPPGKRCRPTMAA